MQIQTYFTQDKKVKKIILNHLDSAVSHVCVAVAWFTDRVLFDKLIELQNRDIHVEVIITNHEFNHTSSNNYQTIEDNGGFFAEIGNDEKLMHMKFCVIDYNIVISGSANWSNKAFTVNNEEVTIVIGHQQRANDFITEFERLKLLSGKIKSLEKELNLSKAYKIFDLIKAFINIGETNSISQYVQQLRNTDGLEDIINKLISGEFEIAISLMDEFKKTHSQIISITAIEREKLIAQIKLISLQLETLSIEKGETEALIEQFNHRYILELNPLIGKILKLKKKIYERLKKHGIEDDTYKNIEEEFRKNNEDYLNQSKIIIPDLTDDESLSLKEMYREGTKYCHPDSSNCIYEDKQKASEIFDQLTKAYKLKDVELVKKILQELRIGKPIDNIGNIDELELLRAKLLSLQSKYE
ncbi:MAG: hypothetical protein FGM16_04195, partial [Flavobacterium sp.]|nr:hypothetical protein [Flavobacterium sp.]